MRPRLIEALGAFVGLGPASWLVPAPAVLYAVAMLSVLVLFVRRSRSNELDASHAAGAALWGMVGGLIGARVFFLAEHFPSVFAAPAELVRLNGGTVSWGAYLGGLGAFFLYGRRHRLELPRYADVLASCLGLGIFVGRWSCFLNGDDFGAVSSVPWAVRFPHGSIPFVAHVRASLLDPLSDLSLPVHPVQLYLAVNGLLLFAISSRIFWRLRLRPGATFCSFWLLYAITRFFWETFRADEPRLFSGALTPGQLMTALIILPAAWGLRQSLDAERSAPPSLTNAVPRA